MTNWTPNLGSLITDGELRRDAIHVAVAPVTAAHALPAGYHVGFVPPGQTETVGDVGEDGEKIGIIDPFYQKDGLGWVSPGERCWLMLYPGTVTGLRHVWSHPAFAEASAAVLEKLRKEAKDG